MPKVPLSVLVANRGEIACRVIRTAKRIGMRTVAVYSEVDANSMAAEMADDAVCIGPAAARESYLDGARIVEAAKRVSAQCIHPGYGFLSESAQFAELCVANEIIFVGPPASAIAAMGMKDAAKELVAKAGLRVVPGYHGKQQDAAFLRDEAEKIGYPILLKAIAGGGGKGMRRVETSGEFLAALESAQREAHSSFGDSRILLEKYIQSPRHIEIQILSDSHGNFLHLFERDCSIQRRHQKIIEEAPAPHMTSAMRAAMCSAAIEAARAVGYVGAGTVEFIVDSSGGLSVDNFYFMEMNTRLQVEHPITEMITGLDLVELQFQIAAGSELPFRQDTLRINGHAIEARLYAEDPERHFLPSTGRLWALRFPTAKDVRVDTGVRQGDDVTPYYDPMIAKIIAHGRTREEAIDRLDAAMGEALVVGPKSNLRFLRSICAHADFRREAFDTHFIDKNLDRLNGEPQPADEAAIEIGAEELARIQLEPPLPIDPSGPWQQNDSFQLIGDRELDFPLVADGQLASARIVLRGSSVAAKTPQFSSEHRSEYQIVKTNNGVIVVHDNKQTIVESYNPFSALAEAPGGDGHVKAPMHGRVTAVFVMPGDDVRKGDRLATIEAMKMEHTLLAPINGSVGEIVASAGQQIAEGSLVLRIETQPQSN